MKKPWTLTTIALTLAFSLFYGAVNAVATQAKTGHPVVFLRRRPAAGRSRKQKSVSGFQCRLVPVLSSNGKGDVSRSNGHCLRQSQFYSHQRQLGQRAENCGQIQCQRLPSTWFISENGDKIGNRPGYIASDEMLKILKYIGTDSYLSMSFKSFMEKGNNAIDKTAGVYSSSEMINFLWVEMQ
jgi:hypothetical protein